MTTNAHYFLRTRPYRDHDGRLVRPCNPDWPRIEGWLTNRAAGFKTYLESKVYPATAAKSYARLFENALTRALNQHANDGDAVASIHSLSQALADRVQY